MSNKFKSIAFAAAALVLSTSADATVISFTDSTGDAAFTYSSIAFLDSAAYTYDSGYKNVGAVTSTDYVAFNPSEASPSTFTWASSGTFDLNGFTIAGAWGSQTLTINAYNGASLLYSSDFFVDTTPNQMSFNWNGLTSFSLSTGGTFIDNPDYIGNGRHWALNDIVINENAVPAPATLWLIGLGLALTGIARRRA